MLITVRDESASGKITRELTLDVLTETITVRELIRSRVYQEVDEYNRRMRQNDPGVNAFNGLVTPSPTEQQLNTGRKARVREVDWKQQFNAACEAFDRNGFFVLVDDYQPESLDEPVTLRATSVVSFVKLTPLVGG